MEAFLVAAADEARHSVANEPRCQQLDVVRPQASAVVSGSSVADIASVGAIEIKAMERHGFPKGYAVGMTLCTSTLASIIPPSILVVIAGSIANVSIGTLLVAGLVPGLFMTASCPCWRDSRKAKALWRRTSAFPSELVRIVVRAFSDASMAPR